MLKGTRNRVIAVIALCVAVAGMILAWQMLRPQTTQGAKTIEVTVVNGQISETHVIHTDAEYLRQALEEKNLIEGEESPYGLYVKVVDGVTADDANQEWWCFTKGGESLMTGVDDTPVTDGDQFEITLTIGYGSYE